MGSDLDSILYQASIWVLPVLIAITLHEAAHGFVAGAWATTPLTSAAG
jgi:hypothetical protein